MATPVKDQDTVWWNTTGANVIEHRDANGSVCSLAMFDNKTNILITWQAKAEAELVTVINPVLSFTDMQKLPIAIQIGNDWLLNQDTMLLDATAHGNSLSFTLEQPIEPHLQAATQIRIVTGNNDIILPLKASKMRDLLEHLHQCREMIKR
jgi:hypothetical protein